MSYNDPIGSVTTEGTLKKVGVGIINKLRALNILLKIPIPIFLRNPIILAVLQRKEHLSCNTTNLSVPFVVIPNMPSSSMV